VITLSTRIVDVLKGEVEIRVGWVSRLGRL